MNRQLVFVHGRAQQEKDSIALKAEWIQALKDGLAKSGLRPPIDENQIRFPYYGDTLHQMAGGVAAEDAADVIIRGVKKLPEPEETFVKAWLRQVTDAAGIHEDQVQAEVPDERLRHRGIANWEWVQKALSIIDRKIPGASAATVALFTSDVYQYLHGAQFRRVMEDGLRSAFTPGKETVVVSHSLGTVVAYNVLASESPPPGVDVPLFITLGSPLGVTVVKQKIKRPLVNPACVGHWFNAMDERDVVSLFALTKKHFEVVPEIENKTNVDNPTSNRHGISGYLTDPEVARRIHEALTAP